MERSTPIILLIEDDEFDRTTLTRLLEESGYGVMSTNRGAAVDTFAINRQWIALILASTGLTDAERIRLLQALHRVDPHVPAVVAARRASHRPNSGEDSGRHDVFVALIDEVGRRLDVASAQAAAQAESFARVQPPPPGSTFAFAHDAGVGALPPHTADAGKRDGVFFPEVSELPPLLWNGSSRLTTFANLDPRHYFKQLSSERRSRRRRVRRIGLAIAAGFCAPLVVTPLMQMRPTIARAIAELAPAETPPLASASLSARVGDVTLVSSTHLKRSRFSEELSRMRPLNSKSSTRPDNR